MPFSLIPFALLFIPILEIAVFILIGGEIGVWYTLALILVTAIIGSILLRVQGISILSRIQAETQAGRIPGRDLSDGAMIMIAGVLLLTPGFVTDSLGFLLFFPPFRDLVWKYLSSRMTVVVGGMGKGEGPFGKSPFSRSPYEGEDVVDLDPDEYHEHDPEADIPTDDQRLPKPRPGEKGWSRFEPDDDQR